jgi:hypothetical protein
MDGWLGLPRSKRKKIDMKEGYRPAAAKKERKGREAEERSETPTASGAVLA